MDADTMADTGNNAQLIISLSESLSEHSRHKEYLVRLRHSVAHAHGRDADADEESGYCPRYHLYAKYLLIVKPVYEQQVIEVLWFNLWTSARMTFLCRYQRQKKI